MPVYRVALALLPLWLLTTAQPSTGTASISGVVTGMTASEPIAGVEIALYGQVLAGRRLSTSSDEQGRFAFTDLAPGGPP